jgi:hypothetical protein
MEIIGDDKKLRALFSEAKTADAAATPGFTSVWHRAQARSVKPRRAFNLSFALVAALLVLMLGSLAVWSYSTGRVRRYEAAKNKSTPAVVTPAPANNPEKAKTDDEPKVAAAVPETGIATPVHRAVRPRVKRSTAQSAAEMIASNGKTKAEKTTIDSWQSPTAALLTSPADGLFKSLPQLNANESDMKSFLPGRSNDKEK